MLDQLLKLYQEEPEDPFNAYALALAYEKVNQEEALQLYRSLLLNHPDYLPTYYMAAQLCIAKELEEEAKTVLEKGIELAMRLQKAKALQELKRALQNIEDEEW